MLNTTQYIVSRLLKVLDMTPQLKDILLSDDPLEKKRERIRSWLAQKLSDSYEENPDIQPLEYILIRECIGLFRNIISIRNENLTAYSFFKYLNVLLNEEGCDQVPNPSSGFFAELESLLKGITGNTGIYKEKPPAFDKFEGRKAAQLRSADLSRMARSAQKHMQKYSNGLENDAIRRRSRNKSRILSYFHATELEWEKWNWHVKNSIRDCDTLNDLIKLTPEEYRAVRMAREQNIPFGVTPYYLSLMDFECGGRRDKVIRAQVIPSMHYVKKIAEQKDQCQPSMDFMLERDTSPIEGITRRYPNIVILKPVLTCPQICVYCQRNWQIEDVNSTRAALESKKLEKALEWIEKNPEINEVLVTGGDPLLLSNRRIEHIFSRLAANPNIIRIRLGTRTPVTLPQRITESLVRGLARFHLPGKREVVVVTHFEHPYEITPQALSAVQKFRSYGIEVYNQMVFTYFNSRRFEAAFLRQQLRLIGVTPYYTFNTKGKSETDDFRVPIARLMQEQKEEARLLPGTVRTDEIVFNVPGLGKNYLKASQHHDVISILPDGRRIYEFHPWEKKLSLVNTYVYKDVSIYDYIKRLKADGEDVAQYRTIWYYY